MKSTDFPEATIAIAKDQPQYKTLFGWAGASADRPVIIRFELSDEEIKKIVETKCLWYSQCTFGQDFQPMSIMVNHPFNKPVLSYQPPADDNRVSEEEWNKTHYKGTVGNIVPKGDGKVGLTESGPCRNCGKEFQHHFFSTRQCNLFTEMHDKIQFLISKDAYSDALLLIFGDLKGVTVENQVLHGMFNDHLRLAGKDLLNKSQFEEVLQILKDKKFIE